MHVSLYQIATCILIFFLNAFLTISVSSQMVVNMILITFSEKCCWIGFYHLLILEKTEVCLTTSDKSIMDYDRDYDCQETAKLAGSRTNNLRDQRYAMIYSEECLFALVCK